MNNLEKEIELENNILSFVHTETEDELKIPMTPISQLEAILEQLGYNKIDADNETNGWEVSFIYRFESKSLPELAITGSLYYGDFKIEKS